MDFRSLKLRDKPHHHAPTLNISKKKSNNNNNNNNNNNKNKIKQQYNIRAGHLVQVHAFVKNQNRQLITKLF